MEASNQPSAGIAQPSAFPRYYLSEEERAEMDYRSIFVKNVQYYCTPDEVKEFFSQCGPVMRVTFLYNQARQPRGLAYVQFAHQDAVKKALRMNGTRLYGQIILIERKWTNQPRMATRGRGQRGNPPRRGYPPPQGNPPPRRMYGDNFSAGGGSFQPPTVR